MGLSEEQRLIVLSLIDCPRLKKEIKKERKKIERKKERQKERNVQYNNLYKTKQTLYIELLTVLCLQGYKFSSFAEIPAFTKFKFTHFNLFSACFRRFYGRSDLHFFSLFRCFLPSD